MLFSFFVSLDRIKAYLLLPERKAQRYDPQSYPNAAIVVRDATFHFMSAGSSLPPQDKSKDEQTKFTLSVNKLDIKLGSMTAIVGPVGSGKTALLSAILGDMKGSEDVVCNCKSKAFVPQKAIVITGTVRDNIVMGKTWDPVLYRKSVEIADMDTDMAQLPDGDGTVVGERGVTLSGGQQQRLAIARAVYSQPDLLVLDDPLAAVDPLVASNILGKLLEWWESTKQSGKPATIVMALNQINFLPSFQQILFLDHPGYVGECSDYQSLLKDNNVFKDLIEMYSHQNDKSVDEVEGERAAVVTVQVDITKGAEQKKAAVVILDNRSTEHQLMVKDFQQDGKVKKNTYAQFFGAMGLKNLFLSFFSGISSFSAMLFGDFWLAAWLVDESGLTDYDTKTKYLAVYIAAAVVHCILNQGCSLYFLEGCIRASKTMHHDCVDNLLHAPISWFESTPSGRILSRFSADLNIVDILLGSCFDPFIQLLLLSIAMFVGMMIVVWQLVFIIFVTMLVLHYYSDYIEMSVLELKRMTNDAMSPVLTNVAEVSQSRLLIHTMDLRPMFMGRQYKALDTYNRINYTTHTLVNFMKMTTQLICGLIAVASALFIALNKDQFSSGNSSKVGLALTYALTMPMLFAFVVSLKSQLSTMILSVERLLEYSSSTDMLPQEAEWECKDDTKLTAQDNWPSVAAVEFQDVTLVYRPGLPPALRNVSICFGGGEHTGVIGRTGAGKSSLLVLLFRLCEAAGGKILVDGVDIAKVGLITLRERMAIIPQHPLLLQGTVQHNLDPFDQFQREHLEDVLRRVGLVRDKDNKSGDAGEVLRRQVLAGDGLSAGEQQLLSFARALLRIEHGQVRLVIMDEPTANIDMATDDGVQRLVRSALKNLTVITIAHRLNTVIDFDKILVMDDGQVAEY